MDRAITRKFGELRAKGRKAFIPFVTAGDPDIETTIRLVPVLERSGSHIVELGIPFSDPLADGPTIQRSSERALRHGYRLADYLAAVREIRRSTSVPVVLFSYFNPLLQYGLDKLASDACAAGVNGLLVTDITPEEGESYCGCMEHHGLDTIFLAAPTSSPGRVEKIARCSRGFVYVVSRTGVTGAQARLSETVRPTVELVRKHTQLPVAVGFGISRPEHVKAVWEFADGAVVGSAIVSLMEPTAREETVQRVGQFCKWLTSY